MILGLGRSPGEGNVNALQYSCLENFMDKRSWPAIVYAVAKSLIQLSKWASGMEMLMAWVEVQLFQVWGLICGLFSGLLLFALAARKL